MSRISFAALFLALLAQPALAALTVQTTVSPDPVRPGETLRVVISVANSGPLAETDVVVRATIPSGVAAVFLSRSMGGAKCETGSTSNCSAGTDIFWELGTLAAGRTATVSFWTPVSSGISAPANGTLLTVPVEVASNGIVRDSEARAAVVNSGKALVLSIDAEEETVAPGAQLRYNITWGNISGGSLAGAVLSVPLTGGSQFVSASAGGVLVGNTVQWPLGTLAAGESGTVQLKVQLQGSLPTGSMVRLNGAQISAGGAAAAASAVTRLESNPALVTAVAVSPDPVRPGEQLRTTISVSNRGLTPLTGVRLEARTPAETEALFLSRTMGGAQCATGSTSSCSSNTVVFWELGTLAPGATTTVTYWSRVFSTTDGQALVVLARARAAGGQQTGASGTAAVRANKALQLAVAEERDAIEAGSTLRYTVSWANSGGAPVSDALLRIPLPAGTTLAAASDGAAVVNGAIEWSLGTLAAGESGRTRFSLATDPGLVAGSLLKLTGATIEGSGGMVKRRARALAITGIQPAPPLALGIVLSPDPVRQGETLRAVLTVSNRGQTTLEGVRVEARIPAEIEAVFLTGTMGGAQCATGSSSNCSSNTVVFWELGTLAPGATATVAFWSRVASNISAPPDGQLISVNARVSAAGGVHAAAEETLAVRGNPALVLAADADRGVVGPDQRLSYDLTWGSRGSEAVDDATLRVVLPPGTALDDASDGGQLVGDAVEWSLGTLPPGEHGQVQLHLLTSPTLAPGSLLRLRGAQLRGTDSSGRREARAAVDTRIEDAAPLQLALELAPDPVRPGESLRIRLSATNRGDVALEDVLLEGRIPTEMTAVFLTQTLGAARCASGSTSNCSSSQRIFWDLGTLAPGATATVAYWSPVVSNISAPDDGDIISVIARATAAGGQQASDSASAGVNAARALTLAADASRDALAPGDTLTWNLNYGNRSAAPVEDVTLRVPLPAGTMLLGSSGGTLVDGALLWDLGTLAPGAGGRRQLTVQVDPAHPTGEVLRLAGARLSGQGAAITERARALRHLRVEQSAPLRVHISASPNPRLSGELSELTLRLVNEGLLPVEDPRVEVRIPSETNAVFLSQTTGGAQCASGSNSNCSANQMMFWEPGTIPPGGEVEFGFSSQMRTGPSAPVQGVLVPYEAVLSDASGRYARHTDTILIGPFTDSDGDGIADVFDNCIFHPNPDQRDTRFNGFGNRCDADFTDTGFVSFADLAIFQSVFGSSNEDADLNGDGIVNFTDLAIFRLLFGVPPGPSALVD